MAPPTPPPLTAELLMKAYAMGVFPMAEGRDDPEVFWVDPRLRGIIPLDGFHISRSLARTIRRTPFQVTLNRDFAQTVEACADRDETWINDTIFALYQQLHRMGHAHSLELWDGDELVGGVYGVTLGGAFFGESMVLAPPGRIEDRAGLSGDPSTRLRFHTVRHAVLNPASCQSGRGRNPARRLS